MPPDLQKQDSLRFLLPTLLLSLSVVCLLVSISQPYWRLKLHAPQYPGGLSVQVYLTHTTGDVKEIDGLNHYIGMKSLSEAAKLERSISVAAVLVLAVLLLGATYVHTRWAVLLVIPCLIFPFGFLGDLYYWLRAFGLNLNPEAPLNHAVKPFVPTILGEGFVGQFKTVASVDSGFYLVCMGCVLAIAGLWFHRLAYKPLQDQALS